MLQCGCCYTLWHINTDLGKELLSSSSLGSILNPRLDFEGLLGQKALFLLNTLGIMAIKQEKPHQAIRG